MSALQNVNIFFCRKHWENFSFYVTINLNFVILDVR